MQTFICMYIWPGSQHIASYGPLTLLFLNSLLLLDASFVLVNDFLLLAEVGNFPDVGKSILPVGVLCWLMTFCCWLKSDTVLMLETRMFLLGVKTCRRSSKGCLERLGSVNGPNMSQLELSWSQLGPNMGST